LTASSGAGLFVHAASSLAVRATTGANTVVSSAGDLSVAGVTVSGSGNLLLSAAGALSIDSAVSAAGSISLAGSTLTQAANVSAAGSIDALAAGAITMVDGSVSQAGDIRYAAGGDIVVGLLDAGSGKVSLVAGGMIADAQPAAAAQSVNVKAGSLRMAAGSGIGAAVAGGGNGLETAVSVLSAYTLTGSINVRDVDGVAIGGAIAVSVARVDGNGNTAVVTDAAQGGMSAPAGNIAVASDSGAMLFAALFDGSANQTLSLGGEHVTVADTITGHGGQLQLNGATPASTISVGGSGSTIDQASLAHLAGGYDSVIVGSGAAGQDIAIDGRGTPVLFNDALVLNVSGPGSIITVAGQLVAEALDARGAVAVDGAVAIGAGNGAVSGGDMVFEQSIDGAKAGATLALAAGGDNVVINGAVGANLALAGLTINNAANVSFAQGVTVDGAVVINATGTVRFDGPLTLTNGSLVIRGASEVIIGDVVVHGQAGVFVIEANTVVLNGDVQGADTVLLRPTDISRDIVVGGSGTGAAGSYNVSDAMLGHLSSASQVVIGTQGADGHAAAGAGSVTLAATDFSLVTAAPIAVYGSSVTVSAGAGSLLAAHGLVLDGRDGVTLHDSVGSVAGEVAIYSANGAIRMDAGSAVTGSASVSIAAMGDVELGQVNGKSVVVRSTSGVVLDAAKDDKVNIVADTVAVYGYGPKLGSGNAIEVQAASIFISAPTGMVVQDTGADGRTHFYVLDGATMYEQAIGIGSVTRTTLDPTPVKAQGAALERAFDPASFAPAAASTSAPVFSHVASYLGQIGTVQADGIDGGDVVVASSQGLVRAAAAPTFASGAATPAAGAQFDYWLEDLVV